MACRICFSTLKQLHVNLYYSEIFAVVFALLYIFAAAREQVIAWVWAIISSLFWAYASYFIFKLYIDVGLQFFFIITSAIGLYYWKFGGDNEQVLPISRMNSKEHAIILSLGIVFSLLFGYFFATYSQAASTYADAFTTIFSILNTYLLVKKRIENWIYWMVIDAAMTILFFSRGAYFFSALYLVYVIMSIDGYRRWNAHFKTQLSH